jgi:glycerate 2-kinase
VRVLIAPDSFAGILSAGQVAEAIAEGWRRAAPHDRLTLLPLSDGGPGFLDVLAPALGGETVAVTVSDPLGRPVPAGLLLVEQGGRRTAYVETAQACGVHLLGTGERDPSRTSSYGVGQLLDAALAAGATRLVVGLGGAGTNDGGAGMLAALGAGPDDHLARGGAALAGLPDDGLSGLTAVRERLRGTEVVVATDVDVTLLGFHGASASYAQDMGATPEAAQQLEGALGRLTEVAQRTLPPVTDLLSGTARRLDREPGAGAGGGLGYGLLLLGGHLVGGVEAVLQAVGFPAHLAATDLLVTGEGVLDWQSLRGTVVAGVAEAALQVAVPSVVLAGQVHVGRRETMALGISGTYAVAENPARLPEVSADPAGTLADRAARVATTWSPRRDGTTYA